VLSAVMSVTIATIVSSITEELRWNFLLKFTPQNVFVNAAYECIHT